MSNIIDFLERMGQDSRLRHASGVVLEQALRAAEVDPQLRAAIMSGDQDAIEAILGADTNVCCAIHFPLEDEEQEKKPYKTKEDEAGPKGQFKSEPYRLSVRRN